MKNISMRSSYVLFLLAFLAIVIILSLTHAGSVSNTGSAATSTAATSSVATSSALSSGTSVSKTGTETYVNKSLGFAFENPHPSTWIMNTNAGNGSVVSFGPKTVQVGVGVQVYYWSGSSEFGGITPIKTITDLKNAVELKYRNLEFASLNVISSGGLSMVVVRGLTIGFGTSDVYFVLLPTGTLNFGGASNLSSFIYKI